MSQSGQAPLPQCGRGWRLRQQRPGEGAAIESDVGPLTPTLSPGGGEGVSR
jgi:hypothetical protein